MQNVGPECTLLHNHPIFDLLFVNQINGLPVFNIANITHSLTHNTMLLGSV